VLNKVIRALHKDIALYNSDEMDDPTEETGWKLIHGDVFRVPSGFSFLSVCVGSGAQILLMAVLSCVFALLGFVSPSYRGGLMSALLLSYVFMGTLAGYISMRFYKFFDGESWKLVTLFTGLFFPGIVFTLFLCINAFIFFSSSSSLAVPFTTLLMM
jgi:transmembrane 9 superfamily member 2/4